METISSRIETLKKMSTSPYPPEPPKKSLAVNYFMRLAMTISKGGTRTPHLFKGSPVSKVEWEYNMAHTFFESLEGYANISILDGKDVLDIGCGWGGKMVYFAEHSRLKTITGFDLPGIFIPDTPVEYARNKGIFNVFSTVGYAENIPFDDNRFDLIIMEDVLEHVTDPEKVLEECHRVLRPGGIALIKFPSFRMMYAHHLDRALTFPALHYILPIKTWASGLNYQLLDRSKELSYEPFDEVIATKYSKAITKNLNGIDFKNFRTLVANGRMKVLKLEIGPYHPRSLLRMLAYRSLFRVRFFQEFLGNFIIFIGEKDYGC